MQSCNKKIIYSETEFDNFVETDLTDEDIAYINAAIARLRRILNWDPGDEKRINDRQLGSQIIQEILSQFFIWKEFVRQSEAPDTQRIQHLITFSLAKLSLYYWISNSRLVADILREIYECDGHFSSLYAHVVNRNDNRSLLRQTSNSSRQVIHNTLYVI